MNSALFSAAVAGRRDSGSNCMLFLCFCENNTCVARVRWTKKKRKRKIRLITGEIITGFRTVRVYDPQNGGRKQIKEERTRKEVVNTFREDNGF